MDNLILDANKLREIATKIRIYCVFQKETIDEYLSKVSNMSSEWSDDETMGKLLEHIYALRNQVIGVMEEIINTYPKYFEERAKVIDSRPTM